MRIGKHILGLQLLQTVDSTTSFRLLTEELIELRNQIDGNTWPRKWHFNAYAQLKQNNRLAQICLSSPGIMLDRNLVASGIINVFELTPDVGCFVSVLVDTDLEGARRGHTLSGLASRFFREHGDFRDLRWSSGGLPTC